VTQPRKEQVKNLKTKYKKFVQAGSLYFGGQGQRQVVSGADYAALLAATRTGVAGGAETSAPAVVWGGYGPYAGLASGMAFTIAMPGVNGGHPVTISITPSEIVILGGLPTGTTSRVVLRINTVLSGYGVPVSVGLGVQGQLVLRSANTSGTTYGDSAQITLADSVPGTLTALGFTAGTYNGTTAPKRGLITTSEDLLGGYLQIKTLDGVPAEAYSNQLVHMYAYQMDPLYRPGQPAYVRVRQASASSAIAEYWRTGPTPPSIVTGQAGQMSNFSSITPGENITISITWETGGPTTSFSVVFGTVTSLQDVINTINNSYSFTTMGDYNVRSTNAVVMWKVPPPYTFSSDDSFYISFNDNPTRVHVNPPGGVYSALALDNSVAPVGYIWDLINNVYGLGAEGGVIHFDGVSTNIGLSGLWMAFESYRSDGTGSITIYPGDHSGVPNGTWMGTLERIGLTPGRYVGSMIAAKWGDGTGDEIIFSLPTARPGATLSITGLTGTLNKLGLAGPVTVSSNARGLQRVPVPTGQVLLPEMVEFSEEPDNYDVEVQSFDTPATPPPILPTDGVLNALKSILGTDGKLNSALLPLIGEFLSLKELKLGDGLVGSGGQLRPRVQTTHDPVTGPVLLHSAMTSITSNGSGGSSGEIVRVYAHNGCAWITSNAVCTGMVGSVPQWQADYVAASTILEWDRGKIAIGYIASAALPHTWAHTGWSRNLKMNPYGAAETLSNGAVFGAEILKLGEGLVGTDAHVLIPRIEAAAPPQDSNREMLLLEVASSDPAAPVQGIRIYAYVYSPAYPAENRSYLRFTFNARQGPAIVWQKDVNDKIATSVKIGFDVLQAETRAAANNGTWTVWDETPVILDWRGHNYYFMWDARITRTLMLGEELASAGTYDVERLATSRVDPDLGTTRTLMWQSPTVWSGSISGPDTVCSPPLRIYFCCNAYVNNIPANGFVLTSNARWNAHTDRWEADNAPYPAFAWMFGQTIDQMGSGSIALLTKKNTPLSSWSDQLDFGVTGWSTADWMHHPTYPSSTMSGFVSQDGGFTVKAPQAGNYSSNPPADWPVVLNAVLAKTMVKSWGATNLPIPGMGSSCVIRDGYNYYTASEIGVGFFHLGYRRTLDTTPETPTVLLTVGNRTGAGVYGSSASPFVAQSLGTEFTACILDTGGGGGLFLDAVRLNHVTYNQQSNN
jgi:hypothetical protein